MYVKLFGTILTSSIWSEDPATRLVWITLLTLADEHGYVRAAPSGIARAANVPQAETRKALKMLEGPDLESGVQDYGGRRIEPVEGGWYLLNYTKYREMRSKKQIADAARQARWRKKEKRDQRDTPVTSVTSNDVTVEAEAEAEAEAEVEAKKDTTGPDGPFELFFWKPYTRGNGASKGSKAKAQTAWDARLREGVRPDAIIAGLNRALAYHKARVSVEEDETVWEYMPYAERFLSPTKRYWQRRWTLPKKVQEQLEIEEQF